MDIDPFRWYILKFEESSDGRENPCSVLLPGYGLPRIVSLLHTDYQCSIESMEVCKMRDRSVK